MEKVPRYEAAELDNDTAVGPRRLDKDLRSSWYHGNITEALVEESAKTVFNACQ